MARTYICNNIVRFERPGYGRYLDCPKCGNEVRPETFYQKTAVCRAWVCVHCGKSQLLCKCMK